MNRIPYPAWLVYFAIVAQLAGFAFYATLGGDELILDRASDLPLIAFIFLAVCVPLVAALAFIALFLSRSPRLRDALAALTAVGVAGVGVAHGMSNDPEVIMWSPISYPVASFYIAGATTALAAVCSVIVSVMRSRHERAADASAA
jgi:hypothetical protein